MNAVTQNRPVLAHARRVFREYTTLRSGAQNAFGEACLELLRLDYEAKGSGTSFEQHLLDLGPFDMSRFASTEDEERMWIELFGDGPSNTLYEFKEVFDGVLRRNKVQRELRGFIEEEYPDQMTSMVIFVARIW